MLRDIAWTFFIVGIFCTLVGVVGVAVGRPMGGPVAAFGVAFTLIGAGLLRR